MCLARHGAARVEGQAPHPSLGGQVRLAWGTPLAGGGGERGSRCVHKLKQKYKIKKNNLSNELAICGTLSIVYGFVPAWIVYRVISTQNAV